MSAGSQHGADGLRVPVSELLRNPGKSRNIHLRAASEGIGTSAAVVQGLMQVTAELEAVPGGLAVRGQISAGWTGACRRCLEPVAGTVTAKVSEVFQPNPGNGDVYPLDQDEVDLSPMVRDAVVLALPIAPLCGRECLGPAPDSHPVGSPATQQQGEPPRDERWAALDVLRKGPAGSGGAL